MKKIAIVCYSKSGNTQRMAQVIAHAMQKNPQIEVRAFSTENADMAMLSMISVMLTEGMLVCSTGGEPDKPVIHYGPVAIAPHLEDFTGLFEDYAERFAAQIARQ